MNLSDALSENVPCWKELRRPTREQLYDLTRGDVCNSFYFTTSNHAGTHVDHFNPAGRRIGDYDINELVFSRPAVVDMESAEAHLITASDLRRISADRNCDVLLLRSWFSTHRAKQPDRNCLPLSGALSSPICLRVGLRETRRASLPKRLLDVGAEGIDRDQLAG